MRVSAEQPWVNSRFTLSDSDIEIRSSDGFVFQLHRILLEVGTGAFPGSEIDTVGEIVDLSEPAKVLEILFAFLYPKKYPDLAKKDFSLVLAVAEAAEKYEVFSAMAVSSMSLRKFLPQHIPEIFSHAVKHDYPDILKETMPLLARSPFLTVIEKLPPSFAIPWSRYQESWRSMFKEVFQIIKKMRGYEDRSDCHVDNGFGWSQDGRVCQKCRCSLFIILQDFEAIDSLESLNNTLLWPKVKFPLFACCRDRPSSPAPNCRHLDYLTNLLRNKISQMPSFETFF